MCQVHIIYKVKGKINKDDLQILRMYLKEGGVHNDDAWGVTNGTKTVTFSGQFDGAKFDKIANKFIGSKYVIGHNRLATQGEDNQPIEYDNLIIAHNGVFSLYTTNCFVINKNETHSDTYMFIKSFKDSGKPLEKFMETIDGSYSMFIIDKNTGKINYLKSQSTIFEFKLVKYNGSLYIIGSTNTDTDVLPKTKMLGFSIKSYDIMSVLKPKPYTIYSVSDNGVLEEKQIHYNPYSGYGYKQGNSYFGMNSNDYYYTKRYSAQNKTEKIEYDIVADEAVESLSSEALASAIEAIDSCEEYDYYSEEEPSYFDISRPHVPIKEKVVKFDAKSNKWVING